MLRIRHEMTEKKPDDNSHSSIIKGVFRKVSHITVSSATRSSTQQKLLPTGIMKIVPIHKFGKVNWGLLLSVVAFLNGTFTCCMYIKSNRIQNIHCTNIATTVSETSATLCTHTACCKIAVPFRISSV